MGSAARVGAKARKARVLGMRKSSLSVTPVERAHVECVLARRETRT
jgi:hypothetical protein